jgi:BASS family bile acid:Na+ symporter
MPGMISNSLLILSQTSHIIAKISEAPPGGRYFSMPFGLKDLILMMVVYASMVAGILCPGFCASFQPLPVYFLMVLFFLSFLSIELDDVWRTFRESSGIIAAFVILKLVVVPVILYYLFRVIAPSYAVAALLLGGISTGVVAPFVSNLVRGNSPLVLVVVVITSALIPFTLPALIKLLLSREVEISLMAMVWMLALVIFVPIAAVQVLRRLAPAFLKGVMRMNFPLSLFLFAAINLGIFSRYSDFLRQAPFTIVMATVVAIALSVIFCLTGILFFLGRPVEDQLAGAVMLGNMNNVLVLVFSSEFFTPIEPMVAAMYLIPFFGLVIPLRYYDQRRRARVSASP